MDNYRAYLFEDWETTHGRKLAPEEKLRWHDLRHVAASILVSDGHALEEVKPILGHMDTEMTEYYTQLLPSRQQAIMSDLELLMKPEQEDTVKAVGQWMQRRRPR